MIFLKKNRCFIVAEVSGNHNGKLSELLKMIYEAKKSGADAVKIQAYEANSITINSNKKFFKLPKKSKWKKFNTLYKLYKKAETPKSWYKKIFSYAKKINIKLFASIFDEATLEYFEKNINCQIYKIASPEITDIPLIKKLAQTKKNIIISNGLGNLKDLQLAIDTIKRYNKKITVLKCTSSYPAREEDLNLATMQNIKKLFKCNVGFSDHTTDINASVYAAALGAQLIEKHVVLNKKINTVDSFFSIDFRQFKEMVKIIRSNEKSLGKISYKIPTSSLVNLTGRKSIFAYKQISKGEKFSKDNIKVVRPSYGLHPKYYKIILNKKSKKNLFSGDPLRLSYVKK